jgi:hypothetical protein
MKIPDLSDRDPVGWILERLVRAVDTNMIGKILVIVLMTGTVVISVVDIFARWVGDKMRSLVKRPT